MAARTTIELPESVSCKGEKVARTQGVTIEEFIIQTFVRELKAAPDVPLRSKRVTLPLVPSKEPGAFDLKDFNFDVLLARRKHLGCSDLQSARLSLPGE